MAEPLTIENFRKLSLKPGDVLILRLEYKLTPEQAERIRKSIDDVLSGVVPVLVLEAGTSIEQMPLEELQEIYYRACKAARVVPGW